MRNSGLDEAQAGIKTIGKNINNLRDVDDSTSGRKWRGTREPLSEGEEESEKAGLNLSLH